MICLNCFSELSGVGSAWCSRCQRATVEAVPVPRDTLREVIEEIEDAFNDALHGLADPESLRNALVILRGLESQP